MELKKGTFSKYFYESPPIHVPKRLLSNQFLFTVECVYIIVAICLIVFGILSYSRFPLILAFLTAAAILLFIMHDKLEPKVAIAVHRILDVRKEEFLVGYGGITRASYHQKGALFSLLTTCRSSTILKKS